MKKEQFIEQIKHYYMASRQQKKSISILPQYQLGIFFFLIHGNRSRKILLMKQLQTTASRRGEGRQSGTSSKRAHLVSMKP
jgi:hypothetical protein